MRASLVRPKPIRTLCNLTRYRKGQINDRGREVAGDQGVEHVVFWRSRPRARRPDLPMMFVDFLDESIARLSTEIEQRIAPLAAWRDVLLRSPAFSSASPRS